MHSREKIVSLIKKLVKSNWESYGKLYDARTWTFSLVVAGLFLGISFLIL